MNFMIDGMAGVKVLWAEAGAPQSALRLPGAVAGGGMWASVEFVLVKFPGFGKLDGRVVEHHLFAVDPASTPPDALKTFAKGADAFLTGAGTNQESLAAAARQAGIDWESAVRVERLPSMETTMQEVEARLIAAFAAGTLSVHRK